MDPITVGIASGIALGAMTIITALRARRSPKNRIKRSQKQAIKDARKASKVFKKQVKKSVNRRR